MTYRYEYIHPHGDPQRERTAIIELTQEAVGCKLKEKEEGVYHRVKDLVIKGLFQGWVLGKIMNDGNGDYDKYNKLDANVSGKAVEVAEGELAPSWFAAVKDGTLIMALPLLVHA